MIQKPFELGQVVYLDRGYGGLFKTTVVKVTKTLVRVAGSNITFRPENGWARGSEGICMRHTSQELDRRYLQNHADSALHALGRKT